MMVNNLDQDGWKLCGGTAIRRMRECLWYLVLVGAISARTL